ncbi:MAG: thiamine pyrophosphate-binding protein [Pseudomonadales bacterium]|nr:thiamine pyrophosphate-binding protein [Pseudomonadales bacterium]
MPRVADYIVEKLHEESVGHVFMVTGRGALFLTDAVARKTEMEAVCTHHEQAAAFAAVAYADAREGLGACLVSTGCASTNALTGVLSAWQDGIPCVFISGQNMVKETSRFTGKNLRTYGQQEADLIPMVSSITKYAVMITDASQIVYELEKALHLAMEGRRGPVWIDVPLDIQNMRIEPETLPGFEADSVQDFEPSESDLGFLAQALQEAERPAILVGSGVRAAGAEQALATFIESNQIPTTYAASAPDIYGATNPYSIGSVGIMGCSRAGAFTVQNCDLLLVLGNRLTSMTTGSDCSKFARAAKVIAVDIDPEEHTKETVKVDRVIQADVGQVLEALNKLTPLEFDRAWTEKCQHWKTVFPRCEPGHRQSEVIDLYHLADCLTETLPDESVLVTDSGLIELILPTNVGFQEGQRAIHPASQGAMGYALPAIVGAHYSSGKPVIGVIGDGSIMMNLQELETIRHNNLPVKIFVVNNNAYAVIRKRQVGLFRSRTIGTDPDNGVSCPEFEKVAEAFGISYRRIDQSSGLSDQLKSVINEPGPVLCEIMGDEDQGYISVSHARNAQNKAVNRPIEDQAPFMDRDLFLSEMIIEPIDQ